MLFKDRHMTNSSDNSKQVAPTLYSNLVEETFHQQNSVALVLKESQREKTFPVGRRFALRN